MRVGVYIDMDEFCTKLSVDWYHENKQWVGEQKLHQNTSKAMEIGKWFVLYMKERKYIHAGNQFHM